MVSYRHAAASSRRYDYHTDGSIKQIELHDKVWALTLPLKHRGGFPDEQKSFSGEISSGETRSAMAQSAYGHDEISWHDDK
jgi:hypothetical protein